MMIRSSNQFKSTGGMSRITRATHFSIQGLSCAWLHEAAFRQECVMATVMIPLALWLGKDTVSTLLMAGSVMLVLIVELINAAIEAAIDRISLEHHELSKMSKDLGSAAVFVSLILCAFTWTLCLHDRFVS